MLTKDSPGQSGPEETPESSLDRTVRLALEAGQCKAELRKALEDNARLRALLPPVLDLAERIPQMYVHLVMDTPEDQALHERVTATAFRIVASSRAALEGGA